MLGVTERLRILLHDGAERHFVRIGRIDDHQSQFLLRQQRFGFRRHQTAYIRHLFFHPVLRVTTQVENKADQNKYQHQDGDQQIPTDKLVIRLIQKTSFFHKS